MTDMRLAVDVRMIRHSGIGTYTRNVLSRLIMSRPEWRFLLLGDPVLLAPLPWSAADNVSIQPFSPPIYGLAEQSWWCGRKLQADLLWVPHYNIPLLWRGRLFVTIHDIAHLVLPEFRGSPLKRLYATTLLNQVRRQAGGIAFNSDFTRKEFLRVVGQPRGRSIVTPLGVDPVWGETLVAAPAARPYIVFVGNIKPNKNLVRLFEAFARIADRIPHELVLIGQRDGFLSGDERALRAAGALGERIRFTGKLDDPELRQQVARADLLVMPSTYEGFGLPMVEAMACGCPVLAARAASLPEVGGDAVAYCDPYDIDDMARQMAELLADLAKRAAMSTAGRLRARHFDWDIVAQETAAAMLS
jgi:glycosyltransferase involved in cell wall biosynthesis